MHYIDDIRDIIGNTPLLKLNHISPDKDINISNEYSLLHKMKKTRRRKITTWKKMRIVT